MTTFRNLLCASVLGIVAVLSPVSVRAETVRMTVAAYSAATGPYFEKMAQAFPRSQPVD